MTQNIYKRGFTLIELLVVIAIISILASVVLGSLNSARDKGSDAAVKSDLKGIRDEAAIYYDDNGQTYTGVCTLDMKVVQALSSAKESVAGTPTLGGLGDGGCNESATAWVVWTNLKSASTSAWCVDSEGKSAEVPAQNSSSFVLTACP